MKTTSEQRDEMRTRNSLAESVEIPSDVLNDLLDDIEELEVERPDMAMDVLTVLAENAKLRARIKVLERSLPDRVGFYEVYEVCLGCGKRNCGGCPAGTGLCIKQIAAPADAEGEEEGG